MLAYGLEWPDNTSMLTVELACYRERHGPENGGLGQAEHLKRAFDLWVRGMAGRGRPAHLWNEWSQRRLEAWTQYPFQTWWGSSSSGKTTDAAWMALLDWLSDPENTCTIVCSTNQKMLEKRIWSELSRFFKPYEPVLPAKMVQSKFMIRSTTAEDPKAGIHGVAVMQGTTEQAIQNLVGLHLPKMRLIIDEMQGTREAAVKATSNLRAGCADFKFLGMGNPTNRTNPLGRYSIPVKGWDSIHPDMDEWDTPFGKTLFFDGAKSPGIREPDKFPFLITAKSLGEIERFEQGQNTVGFWSRGRGFMPPESLEPTPIPASLIEQMKAKDTVTWTELGAKVVVGADPAYSVDGDEAIVMAVQYGPDTRGLLRIMPVQTERIPIIAEGPVSKTHQVARGIIAMAQAYNLAPDDVAICVSGIETGVPDVIETDWGRGLYRVFSAGAASQLKVSLDSNDTAHRLYANRASEIWYLMYHFLRHGHLAGLDDDLIEEMTIRQARILGGRYAVEQKKDLRKRNQRSPNRADAFASVLSLLRDRMGLYPGTRNLDFFGRDSYSPAHDDSAEREPDQAYRDDPITRAMADEGAYRYG